MNDKFLQEISKAKLRAVKNLPEMFFFTDRKRVSNVLEVVENLPENAAIIIREYDLKADQRLNFAQQIALIARRKNLKFLVGKDWNLAQEIGANGVHFSDFDQNFAVPKNRHNMILSYSCHRPESIVEAEKLGADLLFYSPIFASKSHLNQQPVGIDGLKNFIKKTSLPVYALGGIDEQNIKLLNNTNISGIGGISIFL
ncbi:MAG: thiamine phosphate synthase [Pseudomonadota bacterium]